MMIDYCKDTAMILHRIGDIEKLKDDAMNQYALAGPIQQLGECTKPRVCDCGIVRNGPFIFTVLKSLFLSR